MRSFSRRCWGWCQCRVCLKVEVMLFFCSLLPRLSSLLILLLTSVATTNANKTRDTPLSIFVNSKGSDSRIVESYLPRFALFLLILRCCVPLVAVCGRRMVRRFDTMHFEVLPVVLV